MIRFEIDEQEINPEYVFAYTQLKPYADWTKAVQRTAGQPNINAEEYKSLLIPVPPRPIQDQIVALMQAAYTAKSDRDRAAAALLSSTDDYLLSILGIKLPPPGKGDLQERVFFRQMSEVTGGRMDPLFYATDVFAAIRNGKYPVVQINDVANYLITGFAAGKSDQSSEGGVIQIRPTNINEYKELIFDKNIHIDFREIETRKGDLLLKGEVLFNNTNSQELVGKSTYFNLDGQFFCSNHITRIGVDFEKISPNYLTHLLNVYQEKLKVFYKICTNWNNQSGVNAPRLKRVQIPLPPKNVQMEIVEKLGRIKDEALSLQSEGRQLLAEARRQVEQIILGH